MQNKTAAIFKMHLYIFFYVSCFGSVFISPLSSLDLTNRSVIRKHLICVFWSCVFGCVPISFYYSFSNSVHKPTNLNPGSKMLRLVGSMSRAIYGFIFIPHFHWPFSHSDILSAVSLPRLRATHQQNPAL